MRTRFQFRSAPVRPAFTLVELLVAMTIFVILATLVIGAYRGISDEDRLRNGTQQIQSMINGAKSRAIKEKLPRGVRFLPSTDDPSVIDSLVYIGALPNITTSSNVVVGPNPNLPYPPASQIDFRPARRVFTGEPSSLYTELKPLYDNGAFTTQTVQKQGLRIRLGTGQDWYRIEGISDGGAGVGLLIDLAEPYRQGSSTGGNVTVSSCEIEVGPVVLTEPPVVKLPQNIVIPLNDLLNNPPSSTDPVIAPVSQPAINYGTHVDVMFGPNGSPIGVNSTGLLRLLLVDRRDHDLGRIAQHTDSSGTVLPAPSYEQRVVTFIGSTGQTYASAAGGRPNYFYHAQNGQEAKQ